MLFLLNLFRPVMCLLQLEGPMTHGVHQQRNKAGGHMEGTRKLFSSKDRLIINMPPLRVFLLACFILYQIKTKKPGTKIFRLPISICVSFFVWVSQGSSFPAVVQPSVARHTFSSRTFQ